MIRVRSSLISLPVARRLSVASDSIVDALKERIPTVKCSTNPYELALHAKGESFVQWPHADVLVSPTNLQDLQAIVRYCNESRTPIVPYGAGSSMEGNLAAPYGGVCVDLQYFNSIEIHADDALAIVGAGVSRKTLNRELRHTGLQFVVDPGADATIGGMVSTCASGTAAVKYGTMKENTLALECVLADGSVMKCGTKALKNSAGYNLLELMVGSEGTLGIITNATVKLHPIPEVVVAAICTFDSLYDAAQAVATLRLRQVPVSRCELLDETSVEAFNAYTKESEPMELKPTLFLEFEGPNDAIVGEQVLLAQSICIEDFSGSNFDFCSKEDDRRALWAARHNLYYASLALRPGSTGALVTDACVPLSAFASMMDCTSKDVRESGIVGPCFGHAGDGNFHSVIPLKDDDTEDYRRRVDEVNDRLVQRTLQVGGTCTGEHGIGSVKIKYLPKQYGEAAVNVMRLIKRSLDPYNILNPGKVISYEQS